MGYATDIRASRAPMLAFAAMGMVWAAMSAQIPALKGQIGASDAALGLAFTLANFGALCAPWLAPRADRALGARSLMAVTGAMAAFFLMPGLAGGVWAFTLAVLLAAAASGTADVLMNARVSEIEAQTGRSLMALNHAVYSLVYAATALAAGLAREAGVSPAGVFAVIGLLIFLALPWMRCTHASDVPEADAPKPARMGLLVWLSGLVVLAGLLTEGSIEGWSALHLERTLGGDPAESAAGPAILGLTMGLGRLLGHAVAQRFRDTLVVTLACLLTALGLALAGFAPGLGLAYAGFALAGLGVSVVMPLMMALVGRAVPPADRVRAIGLATVIGYGAFFVGPAFTGLSAQALGLPWTFALVALVLAAVGLGVVPLIARRLALNPAP